MNRDNGFGDAFAQEVLNIMNSKEHKDIFKKAQYKGELFENEEALGRELGDHVPEGPGLETSEMKDWGSKPEQYGGDLGELTFPDPGVPEENVEILKEKAFEVSSDPMLAASNPELMEVAMKAQEGKYLTPAEKDMLLLASKKMNLNKEGLDVDLGVKDKAKDRKLKDHKVKDPKGVEGVTMQERSQANKKKKSNLEFLSKKFAGGEEVTKDEWVLMNLYDKQNYVKMFGFPSWMGDEEKAKFQKEGVTYTNNCKKIAEEKEWERYGIPKEDWDLMTEFEKEITRKTSKKANGDIMNMIVAVGDFLGENGYSVSEKIADRLIKSFIVEASSKTAGENCECECECDPCECEDKKNSQ